MPFLRLPVDLTQELLPRLRIPTATLFLIKLFDFVVNHSIDNLTDERANAINSSPRKINSPPIVGIGCVCPFDVCPFYRNARPVFGNCQELRASGHKLMHLDGPQSIYFRNVSDGEILPWPQVVIVGVFAVGLALLLRSGSCRIWFVVRCAHFLFVILHRVNLLFLEFQSILQSIEASSYVYLRGFGRPLAVV